MTPSAASPPATGPDASAGRLMRLAAGASMSVAVLLIVAKAAVWLLTDSVAVLSSLLDSLLDAAASLVNLLAIRHALTPADEDHRFGHGKAEPLAGLAQSAFICGSALILLMEVIHRIGVPQPVSRPELAIGVSLLAIVLSGGLVAFQRYVVARTRSVAIAADSLHYGSDALLNGAVIVSVVLSLWFAIPQVDSLCGGAIALWIFWGALRIARQSLDLLMDRELPASERERIVAIAAAHPEVRDVHDLRTRSSGTHIFIQMHLELDGELRLRAAHDIADRVEGEIRAAFPHAEVIIHQDPAGIIEPHRLPAQA
ncbi:MAG: cation diffusion facilitator family transporter [Alphaproteobacteria bacterium]|nr:cation diffusion facilitator family transporter [Alphaproteobacteria bacterium]